MNSTKERHALLAVGNGRGVVKAADHRKMEIGFQRPFQKHSRGIHELQFVAGAQEGHRRAFGHFHANAIRQSALDGGLLHPGNRLDLLAARFERHAQNAFAQIGSEDIGDRGAADKLIPGDLHLVGIAESDAGRKHQEANAVIGDASGRENRDHHERPAAVSGPAFSAEFAAANLQRLLPPEIARFIVGERLGRVDVRARVHASYCVHRMTSFSSSMP